MKDDKNLKNQIKKIPHRKNQKVEENQQWYLNQIKLNQNNFVKNNSIAIKNHKNQQVKNKEIDYQ